MNSGQHRLLGRRCIYHVEEIGVSELHLLRDYPVRVFGDGSPAKMHGVCSGIADGFTHIEWDEGGSARVPSENVTFLRE